MVASLTVVASKLTMVIVRERERERERDQMNKIIIAHATMPFY